MGRDANNHIFPIAWAVVAVENKETWKWFLDLLLDDIEMRIGHGLTLISDQHKGLVDAVKERVPVAEHRQCVRHIYANFKKRFKGEQYMKLFWAAAASTTQPKFEAEMNFIKKIDPLGYEHLMERDPKSWKRPFLTMLEEIRIYAIERMYRMLLEGKSWGNLKICPSIRLKISKLKKHQRLIELVIFMDKFWGVIPSEVQKYEVRIGNDGYVMDLTNNTCGYRSWQVSGIPCVHEVASISYLNKNAEDYVAPWFHTTMFLTCYNHTINPLNGSSMRPEAPYMKPLPPKKKGLPGRSTLKRKMDQSERESKRKTKHTISKAGKVEPVQVDPIQVDPIQVDPVQVNPAPHVALIDDPAPHVEPVDDPAPHVEPIQVDDPHPNVDTQVDDLINDVPAQPVSIRQRIRK
ncbi:uncharacterized protein LOC111902053 [Lactuca sativa]|uniref:uncharacterized protein LOC111902053 n=1 Tax=Lactuca sativa TaxID=4236 RepID=UPI000CD826BE|nr:uncharacterized protein LOC111902053 [Lactuca sativa]